MAIIAINSLFFIVLKDSQSQVAIPIVFEEAKQSLRAKYLNETDREVNRNIDSIREETARKVCDFGKNVDIYSTQQNRDASLNPSLPFRIATTPFKVPEKISKELEIYGKAITAYYHVCDDLYYSLPDAHRWKQYFDHSKSSFILSLTEKARHEKHIFLRPDFILQHGSAVTTEIETSPFGLGLSDFLNKSYRAVGEDTSVESDVLLEFLVAETGLQENPNKTLCFVTTPYTEKYIGQFKYLVQRLNEMGYKTRVESSNKLEIDENGLCRCGDDKIDVLYRGFYLYQAVQDHKLGALLHSKSDVYPPVKPHMEEKALMGLLFDPEFEPQLKEKLGNHFDTLRKIFPKTWIIGDSNMPNGISDWNALANLPGSKRRYVVKPSGFNEASSWGKGVTFLHKLSKDKCHTLIAEILQSGSVFVIQDFKQGDNFSQEYYDFTRNTPVVMSGRVRLTPYFSTKHGKLLSAKATLCANTDYIHGMIDSINSPIS